MKALYFDCFAGASGDMILGAMVAAGVDPQKLQEQLQLLDIEGYEITFERVDKAGVSATYARVQISPDKKHRHLRDIVKIIRDSRLSESVKSRAEAIFTRLAEAEAHVHGIPVEKVHFHEVGAIDAIIDVVGASICFDLMSIERFVSSALHVGSGMVDMEHGRFPVPPPAVAELLKNVPVYSTEIMGELVTPTGAAIITTVCEEFGPLPPMKLASSGYGAGTRSYEKFPNVLRVMIGETDTNMAEERLWVIETNVDDMPSQYFGHVMDRAFELGALDCYFTAIQMKKNRPGVLVSVLCRSDAIETLTKMLFAETTTLGVRSYQVNRRALERQMIRVETQYGPIDVKVARLNGKVVNEMPEYEQCREAALQADVPLRMVEEAVRKVLAGRQS
jgi:pyridinium-3,5-bisthiocarboxylic acid mononucleotide nickel chelatase